MKQIIKNTARAIGLKTIYNRLIYLALKYRGFELLSLEQTVAFMAPYTLKTLPEQTVILPRVIDCAEPEKILFKIHHYVNEAQHVWKYDDAKKKPRISRYGSVIIRGKVLLTDRIHDSFFKDVWKKDDRPVIVAPVVIAPFSHYQLPTKFFGYFDFVFCLLVKLFRIKEALPDADFSDILITYPPFNGQFETEYLTLLGINPNNLIDSSKYRIESPCVYTADGPNWYPHPDDIFSLKRYIEKKLKPVKTASNRIYVSRAGRRRILNEDELIIALKKFNFVIIEDKPYSIEEQISIYHNASFIIGPHGASFANVIWCDPGTHLFELFSPNYVPGFFVHLATIMGLKYTAHYEGVPDSNINYIQGISEDIHVSVAEVERCLKNILG
ncbi:MAG: glycosyltransferase family 61 protein [Bacteroidota bacterium]